MKRRLLSVVFASVMSVAILSGCGGTGAGKPDGIESDNGVSLSEAQDSTEHETAEGAQADAASGEELTMPDRAVTSNVWNAAGRTYVFGSDGIVSYEHATSGMELLNARHAPDINKDPKYQFNDGSGLLLKDKLYYTDYEYIAEDNNSYTLRLYSLGLDGSDLKVIYEKDGVESAYIHDMAYMDGILYVYYATDRPPVCLELDDDGEVTGEADYDRLDGFRYFDTGYAVPTQNNNGCKLVFPMIMAEDTGKYLAVKDYSNLMVIDARTGETSEYSGQSVSSVYETKVLMNHYNSTSDRYEFGLLDISTDEYKKLWNEDEYISIFAMDDDYAYSYGEYIRTPEDDLRFYRYDLNTGEKSMMYTVKSGSTALPGIAENVVSAVYRDGILYTVQNRDYALSLVGIDTASDNTEILYDRFYDPGISAIGRLEGIYKEVEYDGHVMISVNAVVLKLNSEYAGADKINADMQDILDSTLGMIDDNRDEWIDWYNESGGDYTIPYSFETTFSSISYNDGNIINILQSGYDYYGGVHGMPYIESYVYDLKTGERLYLSDLIDISEDEFDELVLEYITVHMNETQEYYWDGYDETVRNYAGLDESNFYLTDTGVTVYYAPYMLASYAAGFQEAEIPYERLDVNFR